MKLNSAWMLAGLTSLALASAENAANEQVKQDKFVKLSFDKSIGTQFNESSSTPLQKRDSAGTGYADIDLKNQQTFYSVKLSVGTPSQEITVLVDTGSSDLWIMGSDNSFCSAGTSSSSSEDNRKLFMKGPHAVKQQQQKNEVFQTIQVTISPDGSDPFGWLSDIIPQIGGGGGYTQTFTVDGGSGNGNGNGIATRTADSAQATIDCSQYGTFDKSASSSFHNNNTQFAISYGDDTYASGTWGTDTLHIDSLDIDNVSMAVSNYTNSTIGVLGIGLAGLETTYSGSAVADASSSYQYYNFPMILKKDGIIDQIVYSLYLDEPSSSSGSVLFGAVDHSKYSGNLYTVPLINIYEQQNIDNPVEFDVTLYGIGVQTDSDNTTIATTSIPALLDSGTTISYFPSSMLEMIADTLGAQYSSSAGYYVMDCLSDDDTTLLVFDFGGFHITAPLSDFQSQVTRSQCMLMMSTQTDRIILGDVFLQHAYVVYDLENLEVSMAQANFDSSSEDIEIVTSGIPSAVAAPSYSATWSQTNVLRSGGDIFTVTADATVASNRTATATGNNDVTTTLSNSDSTSSSSSSSSRSSRSSSAGSNERNENAGQAPFAVHSIGAYLMLLLTTYLI